MDVCIRAVETVADLRKFEQVARNIYTDNKNWVPDMPGAIRKYLSPNNAFRGYGRLRAFLAETTGGDPVGRIVASVNDRLSAKEGRKIGSFGFFESVNNTVVSNALMAAAKDWLRTEGCTLGRGPINLVTHIGGLTLVEGFDDAPYVRMPYNPAYYPQLIEQAGWHGVRDAIGFDFEMKPLRPAFKRAFRVAQKAGITFRPIHSGGAGLDSDLRALHRIFTASFAENWSATERDVEEFVTEAAQMRHIVDRRLFPMAEFEGKVVGFWMALPDINQCLIRSRNWPTPAVFAHLFWNRRRIERARVMAVAVQPEFQLPRFALGPALVYIGMKGGASQPRPYKRAELSWVWEDNARSLGLIEGAAGKPYKRYRMYETNL